MTLRADDISNPGLHIVGPFITPTAMISEQDSVAGHLDPGREEVVVAEMVASQTGGYSVRVAAPGDPSGSYHLTSNHPLGDSINAFYDAMYADRPPLTRAERWALVLAGFLLLQTMGLPVLLFWRNPDRILLLRPFGARRISRALKRLNRTVLAPRGFTFTLADKHLKNSFAIHLMAHVPVDPVMLVTLLYRPVFRRIHRFMMIRRTGDLRLLTFRLRSRWRLSSYWQAWFGLTDRINKIRSADEYWQDSIGVLMDNCQVIAVDVSQAGQGTAWEIQEICRRGYQYKTLFLVADDPEQVAAARKLLVETATIENPALHRYGKEHGRFVDPEAFERVYSDAVSSSQQSERQRLPVSVMAVLGLLPIVGPLFAVLGLHEIRKANGMLRGELAAHMGIMYHFAVLLLTALPSFLKYVAAIYAPTR